MVSGLLDPLFVAQAFWQQVDVTIGKEASLKEFISIWLILKVEIITLDL